MQTPENATELLVKATDGMCLTGGVVELAMWQRRQPPWRWKRILPKWYVEMKKEDAMLQVKGTAEFVVGEKKPLTLKIKLQVQPSWPIEHDRLAHVAAREDNTFRMEEGNLVMEVEAPVEVEPVVEAKAEPIEEKKQAEDGLVDGSLMSAHEVIKSLVDSYRAKEPEPAADNAPASESSSTPAPDTESEATDDKPATDEKPVIN